MKKGKGEWKEGRGEVSRQSNGMSVRPMSLQIKTAGDLMRVTVVMDYGSPRSEKSVAIRVSHWANVFFFSVLLHRPRSAAGHTVTVEQ